MLRSGGRSRILSVNKNNALRTLKFNRDLELILGSFGAIQSFLLSLYLFLGNKRILRNSLLGFLFLFLTIRVAKSIIWMSFEAIPNLILNFGFIAHSAIAPLFWLYLKYYFSNKKWNHKDILHFIPTGLLLLLISEINEDNFWYLGGYSALLIHQIVYTVFTIFYFIRLIYNNSLLKSYNRKYAWLVVLSFGIIGIQFSYFSNYILGITPYSLGPLMYAIFIFVIALFGFSNSSRIFVDKPKYRHIRLEKDMMDLCVLRIEKYMNDYKPYLDSNFNLSKMSEAILLQPYIISYIINNKFDSNFSDFVNSYRIAEARQRLLRRGSMSIKISEIAYDCGFNSLSSFNKAFKKMVRCTPSQFRKKTSKTI